MFKQHGSSDARERLFSIYSTFARRVARKHYLDRTGGDIEFPDLCQLAYAGLLEALDGYDPTTGTPFRRYATKRIAGSIRDGVAKTSEVREQISFRSRVRAERARSISEENANALSSAAAMKALTDITVGLAIGFMLDGTNLYRSPDASGGAGGAYESVAWKEAVERVAGEVLRLPEREQLVIRRHYLDGLTFEQIGALLKLTKGRVSQLHRAAIALLRKRLPGAGAFRLQR